MEIDTIEFNIKVHVHQTALLTLIISLGHHLGMFIKHKHFLHLLKNRLNIISETYFLECNLC